MNRSIWCSMFVLVSFWVALPVAAANTDTRPLRVSIFSGATEYNSDQTLAAFAKYLESHENVRCTLNLMKDIHDFPGIDQLDSCDVMVLYVRRMQLPRDQIERIQKYFESGKPVVGIRTAATHFSRGSSSITSCSGAIITGTAPTSWPASRSIRKPGIIRCYAG